MPRVTAFWLSDRRRRAAAIQSREASRVAGGVRKTRPPRRSASGRPPRYSGGRRGPWRRPPRPRAPAPSRRRRPHPTRMGGTRRRARSLPHRVNSRQWPCLPAAPRWSASRCVARLRGVGGRFQPHHCHRPSLYVHRPIARAAEDGAISCGVTWPLPPAGVRPFFALRLEGGSRRISDRRFAPALQRGVRPAGRQAGPDRPFPGSSAASPMHRLRPRQP